MTNIVGCAPEDVRIGMAVRARFEPVSDEAGHRAVRARPPEPARPQAGRRWLAHRCWAWDRSGWALPHGAKATRVVPHRTTRERSHDVGQAQLPRPAQRHRRQRGPGPPATSRCGSTTPTDPDVQAVLRTVAWREGEHGMSFAKRVNELGYELRDRRTTSSLADQMAVAGSDRATSRRWSASARTASTRSCGAFDNIFADHSIDIQHRRAPGALRGRGVRHGPAPALLLRRAQGAPGRSRRHAGGRASWPRSTTRWTPCAVPSRSSARSCAPRPCRPRRPEPTLHGHRETAPARA